MRNLKTASLRRILTLVLALVLAVGTAGAAALAEEEKVLNIFTWADYFDASSLQRFEEQTGIKVNYSVFGSNEEMLLKVEMGGGDYDLILASDYAVSTLRKENLLLALDRTQLSNWDNLNPKYLNQYFDPDNVYSVPYSVGSPMIVYNPDMVEGEITSFADLWDPQFEDSLWLIDDARVMIGETLCMLGYSYSTTEQSELDQAYEKLVELKKNIRVLDYDMTYNYLTAGEVKAAYIFTPYVAFSLLENPNLKCVFPSEGIGFGVDSMVILANAQHPDNAHAFLNFFMDADVAAGVAEYQGYINPNQAADALIEPDFLGLDCFHIPEALFQTSQYVQDVGTFASAYQDVWTNFKLS